MRIVILLAVLIFLGLYSSCGAPESNERRLPEASRSGYVLAPKEGEVLMTKSKRGAITIKVSPKTGSSELAMGTQHLSPGSKIPVHVHYTADEILFIHRGSGHGRVGDSVAELQEGSTMFVPAGVWHGVENSDEVMELLWYVTPGGLDEFFRDLDSATVAGTQKLTPEEVEEIAHKHGDSYKPPSALTVEARGGAAHQPSTSRGYVLKYGEGEDTSPAGDGSYITKASPRTGTQGAVMFYDEETAGETSGIHYHTKADEFFYVLEGRGTIMIGDQETLIEAGDTIVVLVGEDHRITSSDDDPLRIVYLLDKPGLEEQFRLKLDRTKMTLDEFNKIVEKFGTVYKSFE